jgi:phi LC3 family holin
LSRLKSKVVWASIASIILLFVNQTGLVNDLQLDSIKNLIDVVLSCLVVFGILNNPTTKDKF